MATKYISKLAAGNYTSPVARTYSGLSSQGAISPNEVLEQYGANPTNVSLAARSVQIYYRGNVGWLMYHGPTPFIASGVTETAVKMTMAYGYHLAGYLGGYNFVNSGAPNYNEIRLGSNGTSAG